MISLTYGTMPTRALFDANVAEDTFEMRLASDDYRAFAAIVNQGIDSHLEAVFVEVDGPNVEINDRGSLYTFIRRCTESDDERALDLASSMMSVLGFEWV
jgi:citrate lyase gamma subunit